MWKQFALHIVLTLLLLFSFQSFTVLGFLFLFVISGAILWIGFTLFKHSFYLRIPYLFTKLFAIFFVEMIKSNLFVINRIWHPEFLHQGIYRYPTNLKKNWQITLLAQIITLTPGTLVVDVSEDKSCIYVHSLEATEVQQSIEGIMIHFERIISEVDRSW